MKFYFNGQLIDTANIVGYTVKGQPEVGKQFLLFGQEPDLYRGGFQIEEALQGKLSRFNWWNTVLSDKNIRVSCDFKLSSFHTKKDNLNQPTRNHNTILTGFILLPCIFKRNVFFLNFQ